MKNYFCLHDRKSTRIVCEYPNNCPICKNGISPDNIFDYFNKQLNTIWIFFYCPSCGKCFISDYKYNPEAKENHQGHSYYQIEFVTSFPHIPNKISFDDRIEKLSASFCEIYNQANSSEIYELTQISGMGYRKALEFLIKDYCIYKHPDKSEDIKSKLLGQVINDYVDSDKIKILAKASTWIGNDETHYTRKFEDKDITDLKDFIAATVAFITYDLISDKAFEMVSSK